MSRFERSLQTGRELRAPLRGREFWRSLEELAGDQAFQERVAQEFPHAQEAWSDPISRRRFLMLMGASLSLAGLTGCPAPAPQQTILPYVRNPDGIVPGQPLYYATAMPQGGFGLGVLVESHEGRPTKIEGNPDHPACPRPVDAPRRSRFGPTNVFAQASILGLYDPDRSRNVTHLGEISSWDAFQIALAGALRSRPGGARLRVLTETVTSPTLVHVINQVLRRHAEARWHVYEPAGRDNVRQGARLAFGEVVEPQYHLDRADVIVSLDADFLACGPAHLRHHQQFAARRRVRRDRPASEMNRLYMIECARTTTGAVADHRVAVKPSEVETVARALAGHVDERYRSLAAGGSIPVATRWLEVVARDLQRHRSRSLVVAGEAQPPFVHALAHALNSSLGNVGRTVTYCAPIEVVPENGSLRELADDMEAGQVDVLLILGGNPVYGAPPELRFAERMERVPFRAHLSLYDDETSARCHWHIPETHYLESWGDIRGHDGTVSIMQPLIAPLYQGKTASELLAAFTDQPDRSCHELVQAYWRILFDPTLPDHRELRALWNESVPAGAGNVESWWQRALHDGLVAGTPARTANVSLRADWTTLAPAPAVRRDGLEIAIRPDPTIHDGRYANNGWLQELPKPLSKLTWENAIYLSPATAIRLNLAPADRPERADGIEAELEHAGRRVTGPVVVLPGNPDDCVTVHLGYGRFRAGRVGSNLGFDAGTLRTWESPWTASGATLRPTGGRRTLARTQEHHLMENRDLVRVGTPVAPPAMPLPPRRSLTLYDDTQHLTAAEQWGMVIDLNLCTGCNACIVACQAENNVPVVGKEQVERGREMHWLRVDTYYRGASAHPETFFQPVPCMHCENAPCELVCPVEATVHSSDGLNDMVYNRCVGTRYCSNNCPYKVRRFNFLQFADWETPSLRLMRNPEVTVRSRGVMEKCTYCVQRIRAGQIQAGRDDRSVRDGEVVTACQATCPAGAIVFGNLREAGSKVVELQDEPTRYSLLADLNTRPRTTYLAAFRNPNPELAGISP